MPMLDAALRVAYLPDSFHEVNGVAHTSRQFEAYACREGLAFLCIRAGDRTQHYQKQGTVETLELARGRMSFALEKDLRFDFGFIGHLPVILRTLRAFRPTIIHITGPSELGMIGAMLAHALGVPLVGSWHTNLHQYAGRRIHWLQRWLPRSWRAPLAALVERATFLLLAAFYRSARQLFAPNAELCTLLEKATNRPCALMQRGVDTVLFSPCRRQRDDDRFVLGYVGRLSIEKNVMLLIAIGQELLRRGISNFRFHIIGHGAELETLQRELPQAIFAGVLHGEALTRAYANMDLLLFPSHTDTFGNVVLEALASGVPALVTDEGGPCSIVRDGVTGFIRRDDAFADVVASVMVDPARHNAMRVHARNYALCASWDTVFDKVCAAYIPLLKPELCPPLR